MLFKALSAYNGNESCTKQKIWSETSFEDLAAYLDNCLKIFSLPPTNVTPKSCDQEINRLISF